MTAVSTSTSVWQTSVSGTTFPPLRQDYSVDVAIVGGGITGLTTALLLKRAGLSVAVLEGHQIEGGVSAYTTAHISEVPDVGYSELLKNFGEDQSRLVVQSRRAAIEQIARLVAEEQIECDFERVPGYLYAEQAGELANLRSEVEAAQKLGVNAHLTTSVPLPFSAPVGIEFPNQAQFNSVPYLQALAKAVNAGDGYVFEQTRVTGIEGRSPYKVHTQYATVTADRVVLATHTPIHDLANMQDVYLPASKVLPYRSYVVAARLRSAAPVGLFWDTEDPYHYTRSFKDEQGELLIVGGEDHRTGADVDGVECYRRLEEYVRSRFDVESIEYRWSAQWYEPVDGLPYIGKRPVGDEIYVATGFSGNGMSYGTIAGLLLSDLILGRENPWTELYSPTRINLLSGAGTYVAQNLDIATHFFKDRFQRDVKSIEEVPRGEGRLVEVDGEQVAAYRDEAGILHTLSPVCTHLGCIVNWNNTENSWDCPCHGGRFSCTGEVLNGPSLKPLEQKSIRA